MTWCSVQSAASFYMNHRAVGRSVCLLVCLQSVYMESDDCRVLEAAALVHMIKQLSERAAGNMRVMCMESLQDIDPKRP